MINKEASDPRKKLLLTNNPNKGGNILKGSPHLPGTIAEWNFVLAEKPRLADQNISYTLQVHPRSIFFSNVEPIRNAKGKTLAVRPLGSFKCSFGNYRSNYLKNFITS